MPAERQCTYAAAANSQCPAEPRQPTSLAASVSSQVRFVFPGDFCIYASGGASPWPNFTKGVKTCPDSRHMQNFTILSLSAAEKSVQRNRQTNKQKNDKVTHSKLSIPHTTIRWDNRVTSEVTDRRTYRQSYRQTYRQTLTYTDRRQRRLPHDVAVSTSL